MSGFFGSKNSRETNADRAWRSGMNLREASAFFGCDFTQEFSRFEKLDAAKPHVVGWMPDVSKMDETQKRHYGVIGKGALLKRVIKEECQ